DLSQTPRRTVERLTREGGISGSGMSWLSHDFLRAITIFAYPAGVAGFPLPSVGPGRGAGDCQNGDGTAVIAGSGSRIQAAGYLDSPHRLASQTSGGILWNMMLLMRSVAPPEPGAKVA